MSTEETKDGFVDAIGALEETAEAPDESEALGEDIEDFDVDSFVFDDEDFEEPAEVAEATGGEAEAGEAEETGEAEEAKEDEKSEKGGGDESADIEPKKEPEPVADVADKYRGLLKKLGFETEDEAFAHAEGLTVDEYRKKNAPGNSVYDAWRAEDVAAIVAAYPDLKGKGLAEMLDDPNRFAALRGDSEMRAKMTAVEAFEFVNRNKLKGKAESAGAQKAASKAHLQSSNARKVAASVAIPRDIDKMLTDAGFSKEEKIKYYKEVTR